MPPKHRFIPGIFNYCDYWCERCAFTSRCRNFAMGRERDREAGDDPPVEDATNAAFWNSLADKLRETVVFGRAGEWADECACADDLDEKSRAEWEAQEEAHREAVGRHALSRLSEDYMRQADAWLKTANADLKQVANELREAAASPFSREDVEEEARRTGEMIEVVAWYHTFIPAKLHRAVSGLLEREETEGERSDILAESRLHDANGSGKVVLMAIERSIAAWLWLREILPGRESEILSLLALLDRMRCGIHAALPDAESFRRPGFDGDAEAEDDAEDE